MRKLILACAAVCFGATAFAATFECDPLVNNKGYALTGANYSVKILPEGVSLITKDKATLPMTSINADSTSRREFIAGDVEASIRFEAGRPTSVVVYVQDGGSYYLGECR